MRQCYVIVRRDDDPTAPAISEESVIDIAEAGDGRDTMADALLQAYTLAADMADEQGRAYAVQVLVAVDPDRQARLQRMAEMQAEHRERRRADRRRALARSTAEHHDLDGGEA